MKVIMTAYRNLTMLLHSREKFAIVQCKLQNTKLTKNEKKTLV